jgi:hypothetical protein
MRLIAARTLRAAVTAAAIGAAVLLAPAVPVFAAPTTDFTVGPTAEASTQGTTDADHQSARRRATFSGACVTEVKLDGLDANNNKK